MYFSFPSYYEEEVEFIAAYKWLFLKILELLNCYRYDFFEVNPEGYWAETYECCRHFLPSMFLDDLISDRVNVLVKLALIKVKLSLIIY